MYRLELPPDVPGARAAETPAPATAPSTGPATAKGMALLLVQYSRVRDRLSVDAQPGDIGDRLDTMRLPGFDFQRLGAFHDREFDAYFNQRAAFCEITQVIVGVDVLDDFLTGFKCL